MNEAKSKFFEPLLASIFDHLAEPVALCDGFGYLLHWSQPFHLLMDPTGAPLSGKPITRLMSHFDDYTLAIAKRRSGATVRLLHGEVVDLELAYLKDYLFVKVVAPDAVTQGNQLIDGLSVSALGAIRGPLRRMWDDVDERPHDSATSLEAPVLDSSDVAVRTAGLGKARKDLAALWVEFLSDLDYKDVDVHIPVPIFATFDATIMRLVLKSILDVVRSCRRSGGEPSMVIVNGDNIEIQLVARGSLDETRVLKPIEDVHWQTACRVLARNGGRLTCEKQAPDEIHFKVELKTP